MTTRTEVLIIGAGMSGIAQAVECVRRGISFVVLEKADDLGGTWRENTYPGAACDIESYLYSYSHTKNPRWGSTYAGQQEIHAYLGEVARKWGVRPRIRFGTTVTHAEWDEARAEWRTSTSDGQLHVSAFLVLGVGGLHVPSVPELPGAAEFQGVSWHSSQWNHDEDLTGKHVALVGVGASGVQVAAHLAERAASLTIFQRTAPWVLPKADLPTPAWQQRLFRLLPITQSWQRLRLYLRRERRGLGFHSKPDALRVAEPIALRHIENHLTDPALRALVTPTYQLGCKRVLFSNDYYAALARPHVRVVAGSPAALRPGTVVDDTGTEHKADVVVYATGFDLTGSFDRIDIRGIGGQRLRDVWRTGPLTYNGVTVPGLPNMFILLGPNGFAPYTGAVHNIEAQARYVVKAIRAAGARALHVRAEATERFQIELRRRFAHTVWHNAHCRNWYQSPAPGGTVLWPGSTLAYQWRLRRLRRADYHFTGNVGDGRAGAA
ncbi:NAD(P)/FAD-dependent oxidoreductase [Lentzea sp. NPDC004782]|uniref:flavin-containing monooxygenase n=1 Tax=Lentzea sp. NPDC004782 TaxID=3154458 RepID=UPI0033A6C648